MLLDSKDRLSLRHRRSLLPLSAIGALAAIISIAVVSPACSGATNGGDAVPIDDNFLTITDCRELEHLASAEVDRINTTTSPDVLTAATARFQRIVDHRDEVCN